MPIFCEKLKKAPPHRKTAPPQMFEFPNLAEKSASILTKTFFFFFFWRPPDFGRKKVLNFGFRPKNQTQFQRRPFFFFWRTPDFGRKKASNFRAFREISSQFLDKPCDFDSTTMKIRVKIVCTFITLSKQPPLFPNPGYAPAHALDRN